MKLTLNDLVLFNFMCFGRPKDLRCWDQTYLENYSLQFSFFQDFDEFTYTFQACAYLLAFAWVILVLKDTQSLLLQLIDRFYLGKTCNFCGTTRATNANTAVLLFWPDLQSLRCLKPHFLEFAAKAKSLREEILYPGSNP